MIRARTMRPTPRLCVHSSDCRARPLPSVPAVVLLACLTLAPPLLAGPAPSKHRTAPHTPAHPRASVKKHRKTDPLVPWLAALARRRRLPLNVARMLDYYRRYNPEILRLLRRDLRQHRKSAGAAACRAIEHFLDIDAVRRDDPDEYRRLVAIEKMEARALVLGSQIRRLKQAWATAPDRAHINRQIEQRERTLKTLLEKIFTARQQNQKIALNRLEAELRQLRELIEQRAAVKQEIITRRFRTLTGTAPGLSLAPDPARTADPAKARLDWGW